MLSHPVHTVKLSGDTCSALVNITIGVVVIFPF